MECFNTKIYFTSSCTWLGVGQARSQELSLISHVEVVKCLGCQLCFLRHIDSQLDQKQQNGSFNSTPVCDASVINVILTFWTLMSTPIVSSYNFMLPWQPNNEIRFFSYHYLSSIIFDIFYFCTSSLRWLIHVCLK